MLDVVKGGKGRGTVRERLVCECILVPAALVIIQLVVEIGVIDMNLIRTDTDDGACEARVSSRPP